MRKFLLACTALAALTLPASADVFVTLGGQQWNATNSGNLSLTPTVPDGNQPLNSPCLICGANQPNQPTGFGYNDYKNQGNDTTVSAFSDGGAGRATLADDTVGVGYTVGDGSLFRAFLLANGGTLGNLTFNIGLDVNDTNVAQTLNSFWFLNLTTHTVLASFTGGTEGNLTNANNGTGYPDYTLTGFDLNRGDINSGDTILFLARMSGLNDGPDSFFLTPGVQAAVPELSTWFMMIIGFAGLGTLAYRKRSDATFRVA